MCRVRSLCVYLPCMEFHVVCLGSCARSGVCALHGVLCCVPGFMCTVRSVCVLSIHGVPCCVEFQVHVHGQVCVCPPCMHGLGFVWSRMLGQVCACVDRAGRALYLDLLECFALQVSKRKVGIETNILKPFLKTQDVKLNLKNIFLWTVSSSHMSGG